VECLKLEIHIHEFLFTGSQIFKYSMNIMDIQYINIHVTIYSYTQRHSGAVHMLCLILCLKKFMNYLDHTVSFNRSTDPLPKADVYIVLHKCKNIWSHAYTTKHGFEITFLGSCNSLAKKYLKTSYLQKNSSYQIKGNLQNIKIVFLC